MKTKILISTLLFFFIIPVILTGQWVRQSPIPTGLHLYSVYFLTPSHGFTVGINHQLLETTDGGATWIVRMSDALGTDPFYRISFGDNLTGFISGNSSDFQRDFWRTTNGGVTWTQMNNFPLGGSWRLIDFTSPTNAFIGANGACAFTSDAGSTWILRSGDPDCPVMFGMDFRDDQVGLAGGTLDDNPGIFKTTDGGVSWQQKFTSFANDVLWWNNNIALATSGTSIYRSTNEGESWVTYSTGITSGLLEMERVNATTITGVSGKGDIWRSSNEGLTWVQVFDGPGDLPASWSINFVDDQFGWVVGQSGFMYASDDGGITWRQVSNGAGIQLFDMEMLTNNYGLAVGHNGYVFKTTNGGSWWDVQKLEVTGQIFGRDESLHGLSIVDSGFAVAAGPGGTVFRTYNAGITWESIGYPDLPDAFWIEDVKFTSRNNGWIVGLDLDIGHAKTVYRTTDGGTTWTQAMNQPNYMWAVDFTDENHGWITTISYLYYRTTDGGATWISDTYPPYFITPNVSDIQFADQNTGWAVGWDGFVARSTNGGVSWTYQDIGTTDDHLFSIYVVNANEAWMTGREADPLTMNGIVYHTTNGGTTWSREISSSDPYWGYTITGSGGNVWISGYEGRIFKKSSTIGISISSEEVPDGFILFQNYPNPFNPSTMISYKLTAKSYVTLKVFDILGREITTLVNSQQVAGEYSLNFDASGLQSGIYFYQITTTGTDGSKFSDTKKMMLIK